MNRIYKNKHSISKKNKHVDRSYLPYTSARNYTDRGMAKWMGFFISEHSTALLQVGDTVKFNPNTDANSTHDDEKLLYLTQIFLNKAEILLYIACPPHTLTGTIYEMTPEKVYIKTSNDLIQIQYSQIIGLTLSQENEY